MNADNNSQGKKSLWQYIPTTKIYSPFHKRNMEPTSNSMGTGVDQLQLQNSLLSQKKGREILSSKQTARVLSRGGSLSHGTVDFENRTFSNFSDSSKTQHRDSPHPRITPIDKPADNETFRQGYNSNKGITIRGRS